MAEKQKESLNIIEIFEQEAHANKVVSLAELQRKKELFEEQGIPFALEVNVETPEEVHLNSDTLELFRAEKAKLTYTWSLNAKPSDHIKGQLFRSGLGLAYQTAEELDRGEDVSPSVLYAAFLACEDFGEHVDSSLLVRSISKMSSQVTPS